MKKFLNTTAFRTFIVDPPTMLLFGFAAAALTAKWIKKQPKLALTIACVLFQSAFWIVGPLMYFDHPFFASKGLGNDFMWNGYLFGLKVVGPEWIPTYRHLTLNFLAMIGWLIQPLFLYWGAKLGWRFAQKRNWMRQ